MELLLINSQTAATHNDGYALLSLVWLAPQMVLISGTRGLSGHALVTAEQISLM